MSELINDTKMSECEPKADFVEKYCKECGTQRCDPYDPEWLAGCEIYRKIKGDVL